MQKRCASPGNPPQKEERESMLRDFRLQTPVALQPKPVAQNGRISERSAMFPIYVRARRLASTTQAGGKWFAKIAVPKSFRLARRFAVSVSSSGRIAG